MKELGGWGNAVNNDKSKDLLIEKLKSELDECKQILKELKEADRDLNLSEERFRLMFENSDDLVLFVDRDGMIIDVNPRIQDLAGQPREKMVGKHFVDVGVYKTDKETVLELFKEAVEHDITLYKELEFIHPKGNTIIVEPSSNLIKKAGKVQGVLVLMKDITERKRSEEKLTELYELERDLRQQIEEEMKRRIDFSRALAHELKTPLTPILASIDSLISKLRDEQLLNLARNIRGGANNLNIRINELLDIEKSEIGMLELNPEPVDILHIIRETVDSVTPMASRRGQSLNLDVPDSLPWVQADETRIQQVLLNLLNNAIQFTPQDGRIRVKVRTEEDTVVIEVRDNGPGISKAQQEHVFEPYRRTVGERKDSGGLGLGLALCRTLVELHGGQIWIKSKLSKGSTFAFTLPLATTGQSVTDSLPMKKFWKVLVIEDDSEILDAISLAFQMDWPEVELVAASFGQEGLDLVELEEPDVVVLDLGLPDQDGFEVLRSIRLFSSIPVVVLSVRQDEASVAKALDLGANDYIAKPFRKLELLSRLKVQLRGKMVSDQESPISCGTMQLDPTTFQLTHQSNQISLTVVEGRIMQYLMINAGHLTTYDRLAEAVWESGHDDYDAINSLRVHIRSLRRKLEIDPSSPKIILTKPGVGYWLVKPE